MANNDFANVEILALLTQFGGCLTKVEQVDAKTAVIAKGIQDAEKARAAAKEQQSVTNN